MPARVVDWGLLGLLIAALLTGLSTLLTGRPEGRGLFILHSGIGIAILPFLLWKLRRVLPRLIRPSCWDKATMFSLFALGLVSLTIGTGMVWVLWLQPTGWPSGMNLHVFFALALTLVVLIHTLTRAKPLRVWDLRGRRVILRALGVGIFAGLSWGVQEGTSRWLGFPGSQRRFTGSREAGRFTGNTFPVTNWMLDRPAPLSLNEWRLRVHGAVIRPLLLSYVQIRELPREEIVAILDCTGGWYTEQRWQGLRVGWLLEQAGLRPEARFVRFLSITGYRWNLPLEEAREALLATHVGDEPLAHEHGAPMRLVAPGRRGFQWVKWVVEVEVLPSPDFGQWIAIFLSGLRPS